MNRLFHEVNITALDPDAVYILIHPIVQNPGEFAYDAPNYVELNFAIMVDIYLSTRTDITYAGYQSWLRQQKIKTVLDE